MIIILYNRNRKEFEGKTLRKLINKIVENSCNNDFNVEYITDGIFIVNDKEINISQEVIDIINNKIEKAVQLAHKEYRENKDNRNEIISEYNNNLI
jgi:hypothetical protein